MPNPAASKRAERPGRAVRARSRTGLVFAHPEFPDLPAEVAGQFVGFPGAVQRLKAGGDPLNVDDWEEFDSDWVDDPGAFDYRTKLLDGLLVQARSNVAANPVLITHEATGESVLFQPHLLQWTNSLGQLSNVGSGNPTGVTVPAGNRLLWSDVYAPGIHLGFFPSVGGRVEKRLMVDSLAQLGSPPGFIVDGGDPVLELSFVMTASRGLTAFVNGAAWNGRSRVATSGRVEWRTGDGTPRFSFEEPWMMDSSDGAVPAPAELVVERRGNSQYVRVRVPWLWLQSAVFPVVIDPSTTLYVTDTDNDGYWDGTNFSTSGGSNYNRWGRWSNDRHAFCYYPDVDVPDGVTIDDAKARVTSAGSDSLAATVEATLRIYAEASNNPSSAVTSASDGDSTSVTTAYTEYEPTTGNWPSAGTTKEFDITTVVAEVIEDETHGAWAENNAMQLLFKKHAHTSLVSLNIADLSHGTYDPVELEITYSSAATHATVTPATVAVTVTAPAATPSVTATTTPATTATTVAVPQATVTAEQNPTVTPATVTVTVAVPAVTVLTGISVEPATVPVTVTIPAATVAAEQSPTVTPATVAVTVTAPAATAVTSTNATVTPDPVNLTTLTTLTDAYATFDGVNDRIRNTIGTAYGASADWSVIVKVNRDDWTPASEEALAGCDTDSVTHNSVWSTTVFTSVGQTQLSFYWYSGQTIHGVSKNINGVFIDGETYWLRFDFDNDNGSSQSEVTFYYRETDTGSWTSLGSTTDTQANIDATTTFTQFNLGLVTGDLNIYGACDIYEMRAWTGGYEGTLRANADLSDWTSGTTWTDPDLSVTWTITGATVTTGGAGNLTPTVTGTANTTPATAALTVSVPAASAVTTGDATSTPATVPVTVTVPAATVVAEQNVTVTPSTVAVTVACPAATALTANDATATPDPVTVTTTVPAATVTAEQNASVTPATVAVTVVVPQASPITTGNAVTTPNPVTVTAQVPAVTVTGNATTTPATVNVPVTAPAATVTATQNPTVTPATVTVTVAAPAATPVTEGAALTTPNPVTPTVTIPQATVTAEQNTTVTPDPVAVTAQVPAAAASGGTSTTATPTTVNLTVTVPTATRDAHTVTTPATVTLTTTLETPALITNYTVLVPATVDLLITIPPSVSTTVDWVHFHHHTGGVTGFASDPANVTGFTSEPAGITGLAHHRTGG